MPFLSTLLRMTVATMHFKEFGVSCIGWICRIERIWRIMGRLPRTSRPGSKLSDFHMFSSLSVIYLMLTKLGMLQSLIRSKILIVGLDGEDLVWPDFLGAIVDIFWGYLGKICKKKKLLSECSEILGIKVCRRLWCENEDETQGKILKWHNFWVGDMDTLMEKCNSHIGKCE